MTNSIITVSPPPQNRACQFPGTRLKRNMPDPRPREAVSRLMRVRRRIETTIGQLAEFYGAEKPGARDLFHMVGRLARKILAYNMSLSFKQS